MSRPTLKRKTKPDKPKAVPSRFAPSAFLSGSPEAVQQLCDDLAKAAARRLTSRLETNWKVAGRSLAQELRAAGHDLGGFDESDDAQEWQATWHHPKGTFSLFLSFQASGTVEVTWTADDVKFVARA